MDEEKFRDAKGLAPSHVASKWPSGANTDRFLSHCSKLCAILPYKVTWKRGAGVAQSVKQLTLAQVMISQFVGLSPTSVSVLTAQSLELLRILSPSPSAPPPLVLSVSGSQK